jgi:hypothetical protein
MIKKSSRRPDTLAPKIRTAQFLLYVNALIWFGFGVYLFFDMLRAHNSATVILMISFFLLVNAGAMTFCAITIGRRDSWAYYLSVFVIIVNAIFTRLGEFNTYNIIAFILDMIVLVFLLFMGRDYLKGS